MKFKWWGHSCFLLTLDNGREILTDPYDNSLPYQQMTDKPDIVTSSHDHFDHNAVKRVPGKFKVVDDVEGYKDDIVSINGIHTYHDHSEGKERGDNIIFLINSGDITITHMGDTGHLPSQQKLQKLKETNILLIPVGGYYTIDADEAYEIAEAVNPDVIIPMHFKTDILDFPITGVENFIAKYDSDMVERVGDAEVEFDQFPPDKKVYVLNYVGQ
ncbi:MAG: MBL fold metallo-hydrolase [Halanaerobiales bacterium]